MSSVGLSFSRKMHTIYRFAFLLMPTFRGCTSVILLDLKESETQTAVDELTEFAIGNLQAYLVEQYPHLVSGKCNLNAEDVKFSAIACDISSEASVIKAYTIIMEKYGRLDVVVASAGIVENYPALEYV